QRENLAVVTALIGPDAIQRPTMLGLVLGNGQFRKDILDSDTVTFLDALAQLKGLGKLVASLEVKDVDARLNLGQHVDEAASLCSEGRGHGQLRKETLDRPAQDPLR